MLWIITVDLLAGQYGHDSHVGKIGGRRDLADDYRAAPDEAKPTIMKTLIAECDYEIRLYSDDQELYFEGVMADLDNLYEEQAFAPLDWAMRDSGCTYMMYRKKGEKEWKYL